MEVKIDKDYPLDVDAVRAWAILRDMQAAAACMPGAAITEKISDTSYKGGVKVKVGPATAQFGGTVDVLELDDTTRTMSLLGKGADKGGSSASMDLLATVKADPSDPGKSVLSGNAVVIVNGKFAQFGGRLMVQVSDMIMTQFVDNLRAAASALPASGSSSAAEPGNADTSSTAPPVATELNGLAIFFALIKNWLGGLLGKR